MLKIFKRVLCFNLVISVIVLLVSAVSFADRLDQMISPVIDLVNFEDSRIQSEARLLSLYHELRDGFLTGGGDIQIIALQLRYALNEELALIATKDGYIMTNPDGVLKDEEGLGNIALGAKYAL